MCLGLSLRTGGGNLITGGHSAGEIFSEYTPLVVLANNWSPSPLCLLALEARTQLKKP